MKTIDYVFEQISPEVAIQKGEEFLEKYSERFYAITNFGVVKHDGSVSQYFERGCHLSITDHSGIAIVTELSRQKDGWEKPYDMARPYVDWLLNRSFASRFILTNDTDKALKQSGIVVSGCIPTPLMQNILIMTRALKEIQPCMFEFFNELLVLGVPEDAAFRFSFGNDNVVNDTLAKSTGVHQIKRRSNHRAWAFPATVLGLRNFLSTEMGATFDQDVKTYEQGNNNIYGGAKYCDTVSPVSSEMMTDTFFKDGDFLEALRGHRKEPFETIKNPFTAVRSTAATDRVSLREFLDVVVPYLFKKEIINVK